MKVKNIDRLLLVITIVTLILTINYKPDPEVEIKTRVIKKEVIIKQRPFELAEKLTGIPSEYIKAQAILETGNFTSKKYKTQHNMFGIGVYDDYTQGFSYFDDLHCVYHYAKIIRSDYPHLINEKNSEKFAYGLVNKHGNRWATDKNYGDKILKIIKRSE